MSRGRPKRCEQSNWRRPVRRRRRIREGGHASNGRELGRSAESVEIRAAESVRAGGAIRANAQRYLRRRASAMKQPSQRRMSRFVLRRRHARKFLLRRALRLIRTLAQVVERPLTMHPVPMLKNLLT